MLGLFLVLVTTHAGQVCMSNGWVVEWTVGDTKVDFSITIDEDTKNNKDWISVGIENNHWVAAFSDTEVPMTDITLYYIDGNTEDWYTGDLQITPASDVSKGGTDDITNELWDDSKNKFSWSKLLDTKDSKDIVYSLGGEYYVLCNSGLVDDDGMIEAPYMLKETLEAVILSNDFSGGCTTEVY
ncbi:hypothetical protein SteCoe_20436 [Stentor coeruleus]|uniref:DOMON domain-containing protein n=1 Tax=Stentor coeruleus TaxID=5963 RepID=A0A1R2BRX4_9CILI|nr:hypothetical protein SteCoe_20436 [Stentor coeruleus]